jgi:Protein of unknown function (DUF3341)
MKIPVPRPSMRVPRPGEIHGVMGEFATVSELVHAIHQVRDKGYTAIDAYSPFPSHEVIHALHLPPSRLPWLVLTGGVLGLIGGYFLQIYAAVIDYPTNIGGKPLNSWPFFVPITFECTILGAALAAVFGMFALNRLPTPYHAVFNHSKFALASRDSFFLCVEASDPKFDPGAVAQLLRSLEARHVEEVDA